MFSLIITIIGIVLVVALIFATMFYGVPHDEASAQVEAARILNQSQQLTSATEVYYADRGAYPASMQDLVDGGYLTSIPQASLHLMPMAHAAAAVGWSMPTPSVPVFVLDRPIKAAVCQQVNAKGSLGSAGILRLSYQDLRVQCYGDDADALTVAVSRTPDAAVTALGADTGPVPSVSDEDAWLVLPGQDTGSSQPTEPTEPEAKQSSVEFRYFTIVLTSKEWGADWRPSGFSQRSDVTTLVNTGEEDLTVTGFSSSNPIVGFQFDGLQNPGCQVGMTLAPNGRCDFYLTWAGGNPVGMVTGSATVTFNGFTPQTLPYQGLITGAMASFGQTQLDFGEVPAYTQNTRVVTLTNVGNSYNRMNLAFAGNVSNVASVSPAYCDLYEGQSCNVTINFNGYNPFNTALNVTTGTGVVLLAFPVLADPKNASVNISNSNDWRFDVAAGSQQDYSATVTNTGTMTLRLAPQAFTAQSTRAGSNYDFSNCNGRVLAPGDTCSVTATIIAPTQAGQSFQLDLALQELSGSLTQWDGRISWGGSTPW